MGKAKITCSNIPALKASLQSLGSSEIKSGGQEKFTLRCNLIVNVYNNGSVTFQGDIAKCQKEQEEIMKLIETLKI